MGRECGIVDRMKLYDIIYALVALVDENGGWKEPEKGSDQVALDWFAEDSLIDIDTTGKVPPRIHHHRGDEYTESQLIII